ncbi:Membrane-associated phospholipid phosphatase [Candidatus Burkholderia brachyanthoides]|nr:Membrane-associated phospholipid phosphatase [Candidatus Burkholderia brachyanthoides]
MHPKIIFLLWIIGNFGDAALTLPLVLVCALWLRSVEKRLAIIWTLSLAGGMALVGLSKILYAGCGLELSAINFRMISGHTMLAASVYTVAGGLLLAGFGSNWYRLGAVGGMLFAAVIGVSRVLTNAHSTAEVIAGWLLGTAIAVSLLIRVFQQPRTMPRAVVAGVALLAVSTLAYGHHAPFQAMIERYSWWVCKGLGIE